jgi:two-component system NtrC family sensor kinase
MLYVGVLEAKYVDVRTNAMLVFGLITLGGMVAAIALGSLLAYRMLRPIQQLIVASRGGGVFVGMGYWGAYLRAPKQ